MNEILKNFLRENEKLKNQNKAETLIKLGLCEREYAPDGKGVGRRADYKEWDVDKEKYYKNIPIEIDDDIYFKILKTTKAKVILNNDVSTPVTATVCYAIAIIIFIGGGLFGVGYGLESENFLVLIAICLASVASGILYMALGKIVEYLHRINSHNSN